MSDKPQNKTEFDLLMREVDESLKKEEVPINGREIHAAKKISEKLETEVPIVGEEYAISGNYFGKSLGAHIKIWYAERYGDKLKVDFKLGEVIIMIRGEPYRLSLPIIYGEATLVNDVSLKSYPNHPINVEQLEKETLVINVLNYIDGITAKLARELTNEELKKIMSFFTRVYKSLNILESKQNLKYKSKAKSDLQTSVDNILSSNSQPGISKWASLQFAEKIMKGFLEYKLENVSNTHNLSKLNKMLKNQNIAKIPSELLDEIQCDPSVRYDDCTVTLLEAIKAHHASLEVLYYLLE